MDVDFELLKRFEDLLDPAWPQKSGIVPEILGYGEISATFSLPGMPGVAFKRMPPFESMELIDEYKAAVNRYCRLLFDRCGIDVVPYAFYEMRNRHNEWILYMAQPRLPEESIGNHILQHGTADQFEALIKAVTERLVSILGQNSLPGAEILVAVDGQISNWSIRFDRQGECRPVYFDITTPLFRVDGVEQLDTEIFLKSCPSFLVWLVRWLFLDEVLDRYYDTRMVLVDLVANFHKEGRPDRIDDALSIINRMLEERDMPQKITPLNRQEVDAYYRNDAFIWSVFLGLRRFDRMLKTRLLGRRYNFILPAYIKR